MPYASADSHRHNSLKWTADGTPEVTGGNGQSLHRGSNSVRQPRRSEESKVSNKGHRYERSKKVLVSPGNTTRNKKLLGTNEYVIG